MLDVPKLLTLVEAMNREGVEYITFGAVALVAHGLVRVTEAADFFIARMKKDTVRHKDRVDADALRRKFNLAEE